MKYAFEIISVISIILYNHLQCFGQEKEVIAETHYINAEGYYNKDSTELYLKCIEELDRAIKLLGKPNSKMLDLKSKAYAKYVINSKDLTYIYEVDRNMDAFFKSTTYEAYPRDKYLEVVKVKNQITEIKEHIPAHLKPIIEEDYTKLGTKYAMYDIHKSEMKSAKKITPTLSEYKKIDLHETTIDTLKALFRYDGEGYYYIPIKTDDRGGYLVWYIDRNPVNSWYLFFKEKKDQLNARESNENVFFTRFNTSHNLNISENKVGKLKFRDRFDWPGIILQRSDLKLKPNSEYFMYITSKSTLNELPIFYSFYVVDDVEKALEAVFHNVPNRLIITK